MKMICEETSVRRQAVKTLGISVQDGFLVFGCEFWIGAQFLYGFLGGFIVDFMLSPSRLTRTSRWTGNRVQKAIQLMVFCQHDLLNLIQLPRHSQPHKLQCHSGSPSQSSLLLRMACPRPNGFCIPGPGDSPTTGMTL